MMTKLLGALVCFIATFPAALAADTADQNGVDESALAVVPEQAFAKLKFVRPILLTHAGDGTNRVFVPSQLGVVHVFPNDQKVARTKVFLDISPRVTYKEKENEEGFLGLAVHPQYKENGQFFVYYNTVEEPHVSIISRFHVSPDDPNRALVDSEEELLRIKNPYWNHKGGTLAFGPDGYLYVGLGDGGAFNDPHGNGQNMKTLLGKILRIDVDHHDPGKKYAIPKDNPFADDAQSRPEIWASGVRNIWRMSFDRETGVLWAADVGQDLWEEIDLIVKGGNYGWNLREGRHKFGANGSDARPDLIDPIWEYSHDVGKSIIGGHVYRAKRVPQLIGSYIYADYVAGKLWALRYDARQQRVVANRPILGNTLPIMSFGEDEEGDVYYTQESGKLFRFSPSSTQ